MKNRRFISPLLPPPSPIYNSHCHHHHRTRSGTLDSNCGYEESFDFMLPQLPRRRRHEQQRPITNRITSHSSSNQKSTARGVPCINSQNSNALLSKEAAIVEGIQQQIFDESEMHTSKASFPFQQRARSATT